MMRILLLVAALLPLTGNAERLRVFVSVLPLKTFVEKVGGDHVDVRAMVRPGHSPAIYDPTPRQISALSKTALYVRIGVPFEKAWMRRIRAANPDMQVLDLRRDIAPGTSKHRESHEHELGHDIARRKGRHGGPEHDPHIWTSPPLVKQMAKGIRDALTDLNPLNGQDFARGYDAFAAELHTLDRDIRALIEDLPNRRFMVFHPAWDYFAETYGLTQVPIQKEAKEPGARLLAALIEQARREQVKVIFVQPQFDSKSARRVARAIGGRVVAIDPLAADYVDNLRRVARQIAEAIR